MHPNPAFRQALQARNLDFARTRGFGVLAVNGNGGPLVSHVPFALAKNGQSAEIHLVRSNPIVAALTGPVGAAVAVSGPDGYVSPDWYGLGPDQVPTWNYVAVHLRGTLERLPEAAMRDHLDRLSDSFEQRLAPKPVWRTTKMPEEVLERMMRQIVPCLLTIKTVDGTWKLNQNKPAEARLRAAEAMALSVLGHETAELARLMREGGG